MKTEADLLQEIADSEKKIAEAKAKLEELALIPEDQRLAMSLHSLQCQWNHTDGCGWYYEFKDKKDDWTARTHGEYLVKARKLMHTCKEKGITVNDAIEIFKMVKA